MSAISATMHRRAKPGSEIFANIARQARQGFFRGDPRSVIRERCGEINVDFQLRLSTRRSGKHTAHLPEIEFNEVRSAKISRTPVLANREIHNRLDSGTSDRGRW